MLAQATIVVCKCDVGAVTSAKIQLACSDGLTLIPPGEDPGNGNWTSECEVQLDSCKPGEKKVLTTHVRCGLIENFTRESISRVNSLDEAHGLPNGLPVRSEH